MNNLSVFLSSNILLVSVFFILLLIYFIFEISQKNKLNKYIQSNAAIRLTNKEKAIFLDTRTYADYKRSHIIGALHNECNNLKNLQKYKNTPLIMYNERSTSINTLYNELKKNGFNNLKILEGGISKWKAESLPTKSL